MSVFKITTKKKLIILNWLEGNTIPTAFQYNLLDLASKEFFAGETMPFPLVHNEFEHVVRILADAGLANFGIDVGQRVMQITPKGQEFLREHRENVFWRKWPRQLLDNTPTIIVSVLSALLIGWIMKLWGPVAK